jgi:signal peptidase I
MLLIAVLPLSLYFQTFLILLFPAVCTVHAYRIATHYDSTVERKWYSKGWGIAALSASVFVVIAYFGIMIGLSAIRQYSVAGSAMAPHLDKGDRVFINRFGFGEYSISFDRTSENSLFDGKDPERGKIYVFHSPENNRALIQRLIGVPGDTVVLQWEGIELNGQLLGEGSSGNPANRSAYEESLGGDRYEVSPIGLTEPLGKEVLVSKRHYYFLGDNREVSKDSRYFGAIPHRSIIGEVFFTIR